jgi:hypothetical protein
MAATKKMLCTTEGEKSLCSQFRGITGAQISPEYHHLHATEKLVYVELEDLNCDIAELYQIPNTAVKQKVRGVISTEINILSSNIASLKQLVEEKMDVDTNWSEVVAGRNKKFIKTRKIIAQPILVIKKLH